MLRSISKGCAARAGLVRDRRAKRVDLFFRGHPHLADAYLDHVYFEVRARAARYASVLRLPPLLDDPEPEVRATAASRLPASRIGRLAHDPEPRVRIVIANRLEGAALLAMYSDADYLVRIHVVRRIAPDLLPIAVHDEDPEVRRSVARRHFPRIGCISSSMTRNRSCVSSSPSVFQEDRLDAMCKDEDLRIRFTVAERCPRHMLAIPLDDEDEFVRACARARLESE